VDLNCQWTSGVVRVLFFGNPLRIKSYCFIIHAFHLLVGKVIYMLNSLKIILEIQEYDMKMIRLMRLKSKRQEELDNIASIKKDLQHQVLVKESEIIELKKTVRIGEGEIEDAKAKVKELDGKQSSIKKVEEFNALSHEISKAERERLSKEQRMGDLYDQLAGEDDALKLLQESLTSTEESSRSIEEEIQESILHINEEGRGLKEERDVLVTKADEEFFSIYQRLLGNKRDRVVVPVEERCCSGCHIQVTAQHENLVRKSERMVFCEHCSRIHYWPEATTSLEEVADAPKKRRRRATVTKSS
jgi:predicted  nucleic acid-binding Zn-ribbon protein